MTDPRALAEKIFHEFTDEYNKGDIKKIESLLSAALEEAKGETKRLITGVLIKTARFEAYEDAAKMVETTLLVPKELFGAGEMSVLDYRKYVAKEIRRRAGEVKGEINV